MSKGPGLPSLDAVVKPGSVALIGATERSVWSNSAYGNLKRFGYAGKIHLINRKGGTVYGASAALNCSELGEEIDTALLMIPEHGVLDAIEDLRAAGAKGAVILSSGYAETGREGARRQADLAHSAKEAGIRLIGPNCLGFINYVDRAPLWTGPMRRPTYEASLAVVSQSGAVAGQLVDMAYRQGIGLTYLLSTGNEADVDLAEAIELAVDDPATKSVALFVETVRNTDAFLRAVSRAASAGKPIVALKVGRSPATAAAAQAHTGSLVGDSSVFDAVCTRFGIVRVDSIEDLIVSADLIGRLSQIESPGLAFVAMSGGMCEIASDQADAEELCFPELDSETVARLAGVLPDFGTPGNPLDITGSAMLSPDLFEQSINIIGNDPSVGAVVCVLDAPLKASEGDFLPKIMASIGRGFLLAQKPSLLVSHTMTSVTSDTRRLASEAGLIYSGAGVHHALRALSGACRWNAWSRRARVPHPAHLVSSFEAVPQGERAALDLLARYGVGVIPGSLAANAEAAKDIARGMGAERLVLKIASNDINHKTDVGGVRLDVPASDAGEVCEAILKHVREQAPHAHLDGVMVSPMRSGGLELLVGVTRDPQWGLCIAVGLGGLLAELMQDVQVRLLPVDLNDVLDMLDGLKGREILNGYRGGPAVNRRAVAEVVVRVGNAALSIGPQLAALEINPLLVIGDHVEALDALAISTDNPDTRPAAQIHHGAVPVDQDGAAVSMSAV